MTRLADGCSHFVLASAFLAWVAQAAPSAALSAPLTFVYNWRTEHCPSFAVYNPACNPDVMYNCDPDVADAPLRAWRNSSGAVNMLASVDLGSRGLAGPDLAHVRHNCHIYANSTNVSAVAMYADREWVHSPFAFANGTLVALTHMEDHDPVTTAGRVVAVTLFASSDGGASWQPARPPPAHIVAVGPYQWNASDADFGFRSPSSILAGRGAQAGWYYATVTANWGARFGAQVSEGGERVAGCMSGGTVPAPPPPAACGDVHDADARPHRPVVVARLERLGLLRLALRVAVCAPGPRPCCARLHALL